MMPTPVITTRRWGRGTVVWPPDFDDTLGTVGPGFYLGQILPSAFDGFRSNNSKIPIGF